MTSAESPPALVATTRLPGVAEGEVEVVEEVEVEVEVEVVQEEMEEEVVEEGEVEVEATAMQYLAGEELQRQRSPKEMEEGSGRKILEVATKAEAGRAPDQSKVPEGEDKESLVVVVVVGGVEVGEVVAAVLRHLQVVQPEVEEVAAEVEVEEVEDGVHRSLVV